MNIQYVKSVELKNWQMANARSALLGQRSFDKDLLGE